MRPFEYVRPESLAEATAFLAAHADGSFILGGGSAAVVMLHLGIIRPEYVVDLGGVPELRGLRQNGALHIGAFTRIRTLELDAGVRGAYGLLAEAASQVANVRVRNVATVGGAVAYGEPQTDTPTALTALDASVSAASANGVREIPLDAFYRGPYETALEPGEIVTGIVVPQPAPGSGGCHVKFTIGSPENKPVANASALMTLDAGTGKCAAVRVVMGAAGPMPVVAQSVASLVGDTPTPARIAEAARAAAEETDPSDDLRGPVWYKRRVMKTLVERSLVCALQRTQP